MYRKATQGWGKDSIRILQTKMFSQTVTDEERQMGMVPSDPQSEDDILVPLKKLVDAQTKMVTLSCSPNECGMLLPMARIVAELRSINKNIFIHADSAQTFGVLDLQLGKVDVDSISGSFHKWPCGPKMVGILYMNNKTGAAEKFAPSIWGYDEHINTPADYGFAAETGKIDPTQALFLSGPAKRRHPGGHVVNGPVPYRHFHPGRDAGQDRGPHPLSGRPGERGAHDATAQDLPGVHPEDGLQVDCHARPLSTRCAVRSSCSRRRTASRPAT